MHAGAGHLACRQSAVPALASCLSEHSRPSGGMTYLLGCLWVCRSGAKARRDQEQSWTKPQCDRTFQVLRSGVNGCCPSAMSRLAAKQSTLSISLVMVLGSTHTTLNAELWASIQLLLPGCHCSQLTDLCFPPCCCCQSLRRSIDVGHCQAVAWTRNLMTGSRSQFSVACRPSTISRRWRRLLATWPKQEPGSCLPASRHQRTWAPCMPGG